MRDWGSEAGTSTISMLFSVALTFSLVVFSSITSTSCSLFSSSPDEQLEASSDDASDYDENYESDDGEYGTSSDKNPRDLSYKMPEKTNAWYTQMLVATTPQPQLEQIRNCIEEIVLTGNEAGNSNAMISAQTPISSSVEQNPAVYHWCFFQIMVSIDNKLHHQGSLMQDIANDFFDGMKQLWILSQVLDSHHKTNRYFDYLQTRYVEISKDVFGRDVVVMGKPMGNINMRPNFQKSAGKAPIAGGEGPDQIAVDTNKVRVFENRDITEDSNIPESLENLVKELDTENPNSDELKALEKTTPAH